MTTTAADWVAETEQHLTAGAREERNKLDGAVIDTTSQTFTFLYDLGSIQGGSWISVDLEDMYVWSVSGQVATVERGQFGSIAATHADGAIVHVKPKSSKFAILRAINQDINALSSAGLFHMTGVEVTFNPSKAGYDLTAVTSLDDVYMVEAKHTGYTGDWREIRSYHVSRDEDTGDFTSGFVLRLGVAGQPGQPVRVHYKQPFVTLTDLTTNVASTLLPVSAYDIPPLGAAARLVGPREVGRNATDRQGDTRRGDEVPARAIAASAGDLWKLRAQRLDEELVDLARRYPVRTTV